MAIRAISEALLEGLFFTYIQKAWNALKKNLPQDAAGKVYEKVMKEGGLDDNRGAALSMANAGLKPDQRKRIIDALARLEAINKKFASNVRRILASDNVPMKETKKKDGTVIREPNPGSAPTGVILVKDLAKCRSDSEIDAVLLSWGIAEEAPDGTWDEVQLWARKEAWPWILTFLKEVDEETFKKLEQLQKIQKKQYRKRKKLEKLTKNLPLWRRIFNPGYWLEVIKHN